jgi:Kdo2-lipid IVA lauroyltransferase/acyltransferase
LGRKNSPLTDWLVYAAARIIVATVQTLSYERCERMACFAAWWLARSPMRRKTIDGNLDRVFKNLNAADRRHFRYAMWRNLLLMICEIAWATRRLHRTNWKQHIIVPDASAILRPMLAQRPAVMVTGHYGNFEIGGYFNGLLGLPTMTIARPLDNPYLNHYMTQFRGAKGQILVPKDGSAQLVDDHLKSGGTLTLLADQYAGGKGCWAAFLGNLASCHKSLALFTLVGNAPMVVVANRRLDRPMLFEMEAFGTADPDADASYLGGVQEMTEWYNNRLALAISRSPEQYWWLHRRWRDDQPPKRAKRAAA